MAIIRPSQERPLLGSEEGSYLPVLTQFEPSLDAAAVAQAIAATGRIELKNHPIFSWVGSAFLVAPRLILTTRHVVDIFTMRQGSDYGLDARYEASVSFGSRLGVPPSLAIGRCILRHPVLDLAVLELVEEAPMPPIQLDGMDIEAETAVAAIFSFAPDARNPPDQILALGDFANGEKLVAPGHVKGHGAPQSTADSSWSIIHDCTVLSGSGGAVVRLTDGLVVGLHFAGMYGKGNYAVPASEMALDPRLRALGLAFTEQSPPVDPNAFESDYRRNISQASPPSANMAAQAPVGTISQADPWATASTVTLPDNGLVQLSRFLDEQFEDVDDAMAYLAGFGEEFSRTIEAQPGRPAKGRSDWQRLSPESYRLAVLQALNRRGLLDSGFQLRVEADRMRKASDDSPWTAEEEASDEALLQGAPVTADGIDPAMFDALAKAIEPIASKLWEAVAAGSPHFEQLAGPQASVKSLPRLIRTLASQISIGPARDALSWLVRRLLPLAAVQEHLPADVQSDLKQFAPPPDLSLDNLKRPPQPLEWVGMDYFAAGADAARSVCLIAIDVQDGARSTGWLLTPDLVVAPAHLIGFSQPGARERYPTIGDVDISAMVAHFEHKTPGRKARRVRIRRIESLDHSTDLMILRLAKPLKDRKPLQIEVSRPADAAICAIQYPNAGAKVLSYAGGRLLGSDGDELIYSLATAPGCAGAPIFTQNWKVIATHSGARDIIAPDGNPFRIRFGTSVDAIVSRLVGSTDKAALWREIVAAQSALRSVDPSLLLLPAGETRSAILELADEATPVPDVEGLRVIDRSGPHVVVMVDGDAARALAHTQGVVGIEESRATTQSELRNSLPSIGLPIDRNGVEERGDAAIVAIIDDGLDPFHGAFRDDAGKSRIELYWDLRSARDGPVVTHSPEAAALANIHDVTVGTFYVGSDFDDAAVLDAAARTALRQGVVHGTAVASIAAGRGTSGDPAQFCGGVAPDARIIVVRLDGDATSTGSPAGYMLALGLIEKHAAKLGLPVVVNISNGVSGGARDGSAPIEMQCGSFVSKGWRAIIKSAGNDRNEGRHAQFLFDSNLSRTIRWSSKPTVNPARPGGVDEIEIWCGSFNKYEFRLEEPAPDRRLGTPFSINASGGEHLGTLNDLEYSYDLLSRDNRKKSRIILRIRPGQKLAVAPGEWKLHIRATDFRSSDIFHAWLTPQKDRELMFKKDIETGCTITIPGTGNQTITVAALHTTTQGIFEERSKGPNSDGIMKPDIIAPGADLCAAMAGTDLGAMNATMSGTSFAAPHVTGAVALALSLAKKAADHAGAAAEGWSFDQNLIRELLVQAAPDFRANGSSEAGYGSLHIGRFLDVVKAQLTHM